MAGFSFTGEESAALTPKSVERRRALLNALWKDATSTAPVQHWTQGAARLANALANRMEEGRLDSAETKGTKEATSALLDALGMGSAGASSPMPAATPEAAGASASAPAASSVPRETMPVEQQPLMPNRPQMPSLSQVMMAEDGTPIPPVRPSTLGLAPGQIPQEFGGLNMPVSQGSPQPLFQQNGMTKGLPAIGQMPASPTMAFNAPGPMVPMGGARQPQAAPSAAAEGQPSERELVLRTIAAETSGKSPQEAQAIASVILNRAKTRGLSPADVVLERNQFEPWNGGPGGRNDPMAIPANSPRMAQAAQALAAAEQGQDPTRGATHFFAPVAQAALGRNAPAWAKGPGQQIGATAFYAPEGRAPGGAVPVSGDIPAPEAAQAQFNIPGQPSPTAAPNRSAALIAALSNPWAAQANPMLAGVAQKMLADGLTGNQFGFQVVGENLIRTNPKTGQAEVVPGLSSAKPMIIPEGGTLFDPATRQVIASGGNKDTPDLKNYNEAVKGGFKGSFADYQIALRRATSAQPESTFSTEMAKGQAKAFGEMAGEFASAKSDIANVKMLREQLDRLPGGFMGNAQAMAVRMGIKVGENASAVEAADAILNRLTPAQRQGMPGAASDRDVAMFRAALPSLGQTKEGQKLILDTMQGMAQYKLKQAEIAHQVAMGRLKPEQALEQLAAIPDPFEQFKAVQGAQPQGKSQPGKARVISREEYQSLPSGSQFIAADDPTQTVRVKP